jgi:hypothetical protein
MPFGSFAPRTPPAPAPLAGGVTPLFCKHFRIAVTRACTEPATDAPEAAGAGVVEAPVVEAPGVVGALVAAFDVVEELAVELVAAAFAAVLVVFEDEPHALRPTQASSTSGSADAPTNLQGSLLRWDIKLLCSRPT